MQIFSTHRRKLDPKRRFGSRSFREKITKARNYKRLFSPNPQGLYLKVVSKIGLRSNFLRMLVYLFILIAFYFLVVSHYFVIADVAVSGNQQVKTEDIQNSIILAHGREFLIPANHFLLMTNSHVNKLITSAFPMIKQVNVIKRIWPNKLEVQVEQRNPGFIFQTNNQNYLIDEDGVVINPQGATNNLLVVADEAVENIAVGEQFSNTKLAAFVLSMSKSWPGKINSSIKLIKVPSKSSTEVEFVSSEGWIVFFSLNRAVASQLANLAVILAKQVGAENRGRLAYIDLRLPTTAYYCFKNSPCAAIPQENVDSSAPNTNAKK